MTELDRRQARLSNYYNSVQDVFWPLRDWPVYLQKIALQAHKQRRERFRFFQFLVFNGLSPGWAATFVQLHDYQNQEAILDPVWTFKHTKHIHEMNLQLQKGTLFHTSTGPASVFDMIERRVVQAEK